MIISQKEKNMISLPFATYIFELYFRSDYHVLNKRSNNHCKYLSH